MSVNPNFYITEIVQNFGTHKFLLVISVFGETQYRSIFNWTLHDLSEDSELASERSFRNSSSLKSLFVPPAFCVFSASSFDNPASLDLGIGWSMKFVDVEVFLASWTVAISLQASTIWLKTFSSRCRQRNTLTDHVTSCRSSCLWMHHHHHHHRVCLFKKNNDKPHCKK